MKSRKLRTAGACPRLDGKTACTLPGLEGPAGQDRAPASGPAVRFVHAEGLAMGDDAKNAAIVAAGVEINAQVRAAANQPDAALAARAGSIASITS